jgi:hypothetical protein
MRRRQFLCSALAAAGLPLWAQKPNALLCHRLDAKTITDERAIRAEGIRCGALFVCGRWSPWRLSGILFGSLSNTSFSERASNERVYRRRRIGAAGITRDIRKEVCCRARAVC